MAHLHNQCLKEYEDLIKAMQLSPNKDLINVNYQVEEDKEMGHYDDPDG
jgi:hypothetical protein